MRVYCIREQEVIVQSFTIYLTLLFPFFYYFITTTLTVVQCKVKKFALFKRATLFISFFVVSCLDCFVLFLIIFYSIN